MSWILWSAWFQQKIQSDDNIQRCFRFVGTIKEIGTLGICETSSRKTQSLSFHFQRDGFLVCYLLFATDSIHLIFVEIQWKSWKGASEELYYDIALLSGARINQIQKMKDEDDDEETQALIRKQEKTLLKVLKYKLKDCWLFGKILQ